MDAEKEARDKAKDDFALARAKAINMYAALEAAIASLFATLMEAEL